MKISIVTAVLNAQSTLGNALESILTQTHHDKELIVIDGGSTDGTPDVLRHFHRHIACIISEPDEGIYDALNKGIRIATGEALGFVHADDRYADDKVLSSIAAGLETSGADAVYGDLLYVSAQDPGKVIRRWRSGAFEPSLLRQGWMPPHPTFYARRSLYQRWGLFDTSYAIAGDYECMVRFIQRGAKLHYVPKTLVHMRTGGASNRNLKNLLKKTSEDWRTIKTHQVGSAWTLALKNISKLGQFIPREHVNATPP